MIKTLDDYISNIKSKYPNVSEEEIKKILEYGFNTFYTLTKKGADIQIKNNKYNAYCGKMFLDNLKRTLYNKTKSKIKLRLKYKYAQNIYNGKYFFGLNEEEWNSYQKQINIKKNKEILLSKIKLYKIKEECLLDKSKKYFFVLYYPVDIGWTFYKCSLLKKQIQLFAKREHDKITYINNIYKDGD